MFSMLHQIHQVTRTRLQINDVDCRMIKGATFHRQVQPKRFVPAVVAG